MSSLKDQIQFIREPYLHPKTMLTEKQIEAIVEKVVNQYLSKPRRFAIISKAIKSIIRRIIDWIIKLLTFGLILFLLMTYIGFAHLSMVYIRTHSKAERELDYQVYKEMISSKQSVEITEKEVPGQAGK